MSIRNRRILGDGPSRYEGVDAFLAGMWTPFLDANRHVHVLARDTGAPGVGLSRVDIHALPRRTV